MLCVSGTGFCVLRGKGEGRGNEREERGERGGKGRENERGEKGGVVHNATDAILNGNCLTFRTARFRKKVFPSDENFPLPPEMFHLDAGKF